MNKNLEISKIIWNRIDEFYKLKNQDERLEFIIKSRNQYLNNISTNKKTRNVRRKNNKKRNNENV